MKEMSSIGERASFDYFVNKLGNEKSFVRLVQIRIESSCIFGSAAVPTL